MSAGTGEDFSFAFLSILFEGAPFILLGTLVSGLLEVYLPAGAMDRLLPKKTLPAVAVAGLLGAVFPVCECAVVPVIRRLVGKGLPVSCALTYMLAAPIVNPITALATWKAFQGPWQGMMTGSRMLAGYLVAVAVGLIASRLKPTAMLRPKLAAGLAQPQGAVVCDDGCGCCGHDKTPSDAGLVAAFRAALKDFVEVGVYFTIGVAITALFNTGIAPGAQWLDQAAAHPAGASAALMALAFILSLCSTSDAFIAATLAKFPWGAKLAFLTFGPMMDVKLVFLYRTVFTRRFVFTLAIGLFVGIGVLTVFWERLVSVFFQP